MVPYRLIENYVVIEYRKGEKMGKLFFTQDTFKDVIGGLSERIGWNMKCLREDGKVERWRVKRHVNAAGNDFIEVGRYVINVPLIGLPVYPNNDTELDVLWHTITDDLHLRPYVKDKKEMARLRYDYPKATERLTEKQAEKVAMMMLHAASYEGTKVTLYPVISHRRCRDENDAVLADALLRLLTAEGAEVERQDIIEELEYCHEEGDFVKMTYRFTADAVNRLMEKYQTAPRMTYKSDQKVRKIILFDGSHDVSNPCFSEWAFHRIDLTFIDCYKFTGQHGNKEDLRTKLRWMNEMEEW